MNFLAVKIKDNSFYRVQCKLSVFGNEELLDALHLVNPVFPNQFFLVLSLEQESFIRILSDYPDCQRGLRWTPSFTLTQTITFRLSFEVFYVLSLLVSIKGAPVCQRQGGNSKTSQVSFISNIKHLRNDLYWWRDRMGTYTVNIFLANGRYISIPWGSFICTSSRLHL